MVENIGKNIGGPVGILNFLTPNFRKTSGRGEFSFVNTDGSMNKDGILIKMGEIALSSAMEKKKGNGPALNDTTPIESLATLISLKAEKNIEKALKN